MAAPIFIGSVSFVFFTKLIIDYFQFPKVISVVSISLSMAGFSSWLEWQCDFGDVKVADFVVVFVEKSDVGYLENAYDWFHLLFV